MCRGQKGNQRNFAESEMKHFFRNHYKNVKNSKFRICDEGTSILGKITFLGITAGAREKKGEAPYAVDGRL